MNDLSFIQDVENYVCIFNINIIPLLWYFFLIIFIISGLILIIYVFLRSKQPDDWEHRPLTDEFYNTGSLTNLSESIRINQYSYGNENDLKNHIIMMFFEKIRTIHDLPIGLLIEMKDKNPNKLEALIDDKEISNWILFNKKEKKNLFENKKTKKERFFNNYNKILAKMEAWGE